MYAFSFVFANFGIAIAARMPMMTTTISSSISVKPLRFILTSPLPGGGRDARADSWQTLEGFADRRSTPWRDPAERRRLPAGLACHGTWNADVGATDAERVAKNQTSVCGGRLEYISRLEMGPIRWMGGRERDRSFGGIAEGSRYA